MLPDITVQLAGRVGSWRPRHVCDQARTVWAAWLRTIQHGIVGVYVLAKPNAHLELAEALPNGVWVEVCGALCPLRVQALADDPRAADEVACSPLLVHAYQVRQVRRSPHAPPLLPSVATLQVRAGVQTRAGNLAPAAHIPDLYHLAANEDARGAVRSWSTLRGVIAVVGPYRFLRYVVTEAGS